MSLKINKKRSNIDDVIYDDAYDDIIGNWNVKANEELTKYMAKQVQDAINIEIMKQLMDSASCVDSKPITDMIDPYNHPMYRPAVTVKFNKDGQIVLGYENNL